MMHARSEDELLRRVCRVIVDAEGYLGAWVGFKGNDAYKSLTPQAVAGLDPESLLEVEYSWGESKEGNMPPGQAARTGKPARVNNVFLESECESCRELARAVGYQSVLALPLIVDDATVGVLVIYARDINAFSDEEITLLTDLGRDLSFGLQSLRIRMARRDAAIKLRESEQQFKAIFENAQDGILVVDIKTHRFLTGNHYVCNMLGYSVEELTNLGIEDIHPPGVMDRAQSAFAMCVKNGQGLVEDMPLLCKNGSVRYVDISAATVEIGESGYLIGSFRDITERKQAEQSLERTNRALRTLSRCNEILIHARKEEQLLDDICHAIVEQGAFQLVWVGLAEEDKDKSIRIAARYGQATAILDDAAISWAGPDADPGPTGSAIRSGEAQVERYISRADDPAPWRRVAAEHGLASFIALPLCQGDTVLGAVSIYSDKEDVFDGEEANLLMELAQDLAYGIASQRARVAHEEAIQAIKHSEHNLHNIINHEADGIMVLDANDTILFTNPALEKMLGRESRHFIGTQFGFPIADEDFSEIEIFNQDGDLIQCEMRVTDVDWLNNPARLVSVHDISERIRLAKEREENIKRQQEMLVETITAMSNAVETRDPYTAGHMRRVSSLSIAIAEQLGLDEDRIEGIRLGSIIHDIGKISVPAEILNRPGRLSTAEFDIIKSHSQVGYDIIKGVSFRWPVAEMVYQHHERIDGSGYPNGLKGDEIVFEARILAVADVVEAMSSHRPYRPSLGLGPALEEIRKNRGKIYDSEVVDACLQVIEMGRFSIEK
jgi:PAS domain S-box-containing protein/putative nucleotidyltransferase with HDIG domain